MRLIDADALIKTLKTLEMELEQFGEYERGIMRALKEIAPDIINDEPTAFDKEKVIEYMENRQEQCSNVRDDYHYGIACGIENSIHIIEKGGLDANN